MNKLSLLLAGAMMMPVFANADNMAVKVASTSNERDYYRVEIPQTILTTPGKPVSFTMASWIKFDEATRSGKTLVMGHRAQDYDNDNGSCFVLLNTDNTLTIGGKNVNAPEDILFEEPLSAEDYHFVVFAVNAEEYEAQLYVDGQIVCATDFTDSWEFFGDTNSFLSGIFFVGNNKLGATVDEVAVYNHCLDAAEVDEAMTGADKVAGLTALYTFDEVAEGTTSAFPNMSTDEVAADANAYLHHNQANTSLWGSWKLSSSDEFEPEFVEGRQLAADYCVDFTSKTSRADRYTSALKLTNDRGTEFTVDGIQTGASGQNIYFDKTETVVTFPAGTEVVLTPQGAGEWMHAYLYIDLNKDGVFSYDALDVETGIPGEGCELVAHTGVDNGSGKFFDSKGNPNANSSYSTMTTPLPGFVIPENLRPGKYRARYRVAWSNLDPCSELSELPSNTLSAHGGIVVDFTFEVVRDAHEMRDITIASADEALGTVEFVGVEVEGATLTTTDNVTVKATVVDPDAFFVNWTDAEGNEVSTDEEYTYTGDENITLTANFQQHFAVTFGKEVKVSTELGAIASGDLINKGTELTVTVNVPEGKTIEAVKVNETALEAVEGKYNFVVEAASVITVDFKDILCLVTVETEGEGKVVIATENNDGNPDGTIYKHGDTIPYNTELYVFLYPAEGMKVVEAFVIDYDYLEGTEGEEYTVLPEGGIVIPTAAYDENFLVRSRFAVDPTAIEVVAAEADANAVYYNLQGVRVERANLVPGIYVRRAADKAQKVIVK